jgi:hypothetical protein
MKTHRGQTPLMDWLNGGDHAIFLSRTPYVSTWMSNTPVRKVYIRDKAKNNHDSDKVRRNSDVYSNDKDKMVVLLSEEDRKILYHYSNVKDNYADFCDVYTTPNDGKFNEVSKILDGDRDFYRSFFMDVVKNKRVVESIFNDMIKPLFPKKIKFLLSDDPFHPKLGWQYHFDPITIQEYIEFYEIVKRGLNQGDDTFAMMRICPKCSKLFVAKTNKTIFCSPSCRVMHQRQHGPEK